MSFTREKPRLNADNLISSEMGDFWDIVQNKRPLEVAWAIYIEIAQLLLQKLYQLDNEISINDIQSKNIKLGKVIDIESDSNINKIEIDNNIKSIPEIHSDIMYPKKIFVEGEDYVVRDYRGKTWIDFKEARGAINPEVFTSNNSRYMYIPIIVNNDFRIYKKFGTLVGEQPPKLTQDVRPMFDQGDRWSDDINWDDGQKEEETYRKENEAYRKAIRGLWHALHFGPTIKNLRVALYLLYGRPVNEEPGIISNIEENGNETVLSVDESIRQDNFKFSDSRINRSSTFVENGQTYYLVQTNNNEVSPRSTSINNVDVVYRHTKYNDAYIKRYDSDKAILQGNSLYIANDVADSHDEYFRVIFNKDAGGQISEYRLGDLDLKDGLNEGDAVERFDIFTEEIELQDIKTPGESPDGKRFGIEGTRRGIEEWNRQKRPPGLYKIWIDNKAISGSEIYKDTKHFLNKFEPIYSHFDFEISNIPFVVSGIGELTDEYVEDQLEKLSEGVVTFNEDIEFFEEGIDVFQSAFESEIAYAKEIANVFWDRSTYAEKYLQGTSDIDYSIEADTWAQANGSGVTWDNMDSGLQEEIFYDDNDHYDSGLKWDQGGTFRPYIWDFDSNSSDDFQKAFWNDEPAPDRWDWESFFN